MLPVIREKEIVNHLPILVSGGGFDQLLAVLKLPLGIGEATAAAIKEAALSWRVSDIVKAISFGKTAINTGRLSDACVLL